MTHLAQLPQRALVHQLVLPGEVPAALLVGLDGGVGFPLVHSHRGWHRGSRVGQGSGRTGLRSRVHWGSLPGQDRCRVRGKRLQTLSPAKTGPSTSNGHEWHSCTISKSLTEPPCLPAPPAPQGVIHEARLRWRTASRVMGGH